MDKALVVAPVPGVVSQVGSLNIGQYVTPGTMVASVVQTDETWIEANFKETQIEDLEVGQVVDVEIDAYPDVMLHGTVESLGSATGSQMSLIPAQNATGNWVKVVQRLPVRIRIEADLDHPLRGGMSAHVSVDGGQSRLDSLL
jgi:membrane fusion protein (multidrug efflux system)